MEKMRTKAIQAARLYRPETALREGGMRLCEIAERTPSEIQNQRDGRMEVQRWGLLNHISVLKGFAAIC